MLIIIGLGNPGKEYEMTRHNVGFMIVEKLRERWDFSVFEYGKKFEASFSKGKFQDKDIILAKPETFMNLSGRAVKNILDFYKLSPRDMLVIHDDIDLPLGRYKVAEDSGSAGHNGVEDIISKIGTNNFRRIRIGVASGDLRTKVDPSDFVLQKFSDEEMRNIEELSQDIIKSLETAIS